MKTTLILGVRVAEEDSGTVVEEIALHVSRGLSGYVCVGNAHQYVLANTDKAFGEILASSAYNIFDSQVIAYAVWLKRRRSLRIMRGLELTVALCRKAEQLKFPVGFYGTTVETLEALRTQLLKQFPRLKIVYTDAPGIMHFDRIDADKSTCQRIREAGVQLLFVGLGCPKQEKWMHMQRHLLDCTQIGVGAAFDYIAHAVPASPVWLHRCGLEWAYRLCREPRRLWQRYLVTNTMFLWYFAKDLIASRRA